MTAYNVYTPFCASPPPFLGCDVHIYTLHFALWQKSKTRHICTKIEHIYYKANYDHLLINYCIGYIVAKL